MTPCRLRRLSPFPRGTILPLGKGETARSAEGSGLAPISLKLPLISADKRNVSAEFVYGPRWQEVQIEAGNPGLNASLHFGGLVVGRWVG